MKVGKINIPEEGKPAAIGSYVDGKGKAILGVLLIDVASQVEALDKDVTHLEVYIQGPGGIVDVGDQIHDYLEGLKTSRNLSIKTIQTGHLASISTKIWMVGDERVADESFDFIIHNPWSDPGPGDANHHLANLEALMVEEDKLRKYYAGRTGLDEMLLKPFMDEETNITGEQLLSLHFATSLKKRKVLAMKTETKPASFQERLAAIHAMVFNSNAATPAPGAAAAPKALDIPLADGKTLVSDAADAASLKGSAVTLDGAAPADGDYPASDGTVVKVAGGKVADVVANPAAKKDQPDPAQALTARIEAMEASMGKIVDTLGQMIEASKGAVTAAVTEASKSWDEKLNGQIMALKGEIGTVHDPARAATVYSANVDKNPAGHMSISARLKEKAAKRQEVLASR